MAKPASIGDDGTFRGAVDDVRDNTIAVGWVSASESTGGNFGVAILVNGISAGVHRASMAREGIPNARIFAVELAAFASAGDLITLSHPDNNIALANGVFRLKSKPAVAAPQLQSNGGGGNSGDMEERVKALEVHIDHIREDLKRLSAVPSDLAEIKATLRALPDKDWVDGRFAKQMILITGVVGLIVSIGTAISLFVRH